MARYKETSSLAENAAVSRKAYLQLLERSRRPAANAGVLQKVRQIQADLYIYETPLPYGGALLLVNAGGKKVSTGVVNVPVKDLFANLDEPHITPERRRKLMAHLTNRIDMPDSKRVVLQQAHRLLATSDNLPALAATCGILHWLVRSDLNYREGWVLDFEYWKKFAEQQSSR